MKKIDFLQVYKDTINHLPQVGKVDFPVLLGFLYLILIPLFFFCIIVCFFLYPIQEIVILIFTIFQKLLQLISNVFKLGDTK